MSRAKPAYVPRPDSLPARLIAFFGRNPDESLSLEDITEKFDVSRGHIHTMLALAKDAGMLELSKDEDGAYVYTAGKNLSQPYAEACASIENAQAEWAAKDPRKVVTPGTPRTPLPNASTIVIEDNVPIPNIRGNLDTDYTPALAKLKPKQSFVLPVAAKYALIKQIVTLHKAKQSRYTVRVDKTTQQVRVWRTA